MKTRKQITEWLREKHLLGRVLNYNGNDDIRDGYDEGLCWNIAMISSAFTWSESPEGHDFWSAIDRTYREWYIQS